MAEGIQIGRGYIAIDLDEAGARAVLDAFAEKVKRTLNEASKKTQLDISTAKADAELDKTDEKVKKVQKDAKSGGDPFANWGQSLGNLSRYIGLWAPLVSVATLASQAGAGGILAVVGAIGNLTGALGLLPAAGAVAVGSLAAITIGVQNVGKALATAHTPAQLKAQNAALAQLAPNAQAFVKAVQGIKPALNDLRLADQNALFGTLGKTVKSLATQELPVLKSGLTGIASALSTGAGNFLANLGSANSLRDQALLFQEIRNTLQALAPAGAQFYNILINLAAVGGRFLPGLAAGFTGLLTRFDAFVQHARSDGSLQQWIQTGITAVGSLLAAVKNLGSILGALFTAGQSSGANFLGTLSNITAQFGSFLHSVQGQLDLATILSSASSAASVLVPLLKDALTALAGFAPVLSPIANTLAPAVDKVIQALGPALRNLNPGLTALASGVASILSAVSHLLDPVSRLASEIGSALGPALSILSHVIEGLAPILSAVATALGAIERATGPLLPILAAATAGFVAFSKAQSLFSADGGAAGKGIASAAKSMSDFALNAGVAVEKVTGSAKAGEAVAGLGDKIAGGLKSVGSAIPFVGVALLGIGTIIQAVKDHAAALAQEAQDVGKGLVVGGSAGVDAAAKMTQYQQAVDKAKASLDALAQAGKLGVPDRGRADSQRGLAGTRDQADLQSAQKQFDDAKAAAENYRESLSTVQFAQAQVAQAQSDYNSAVARFGPTSAQAQSALEILKVRTQAESDQEFAAAQATKTHQQALQDLMNQTLASANASANLKLAQLDLSDAQKAVADATKKSGANSEEAQRAEAQYELQLNQTVQAMHDKAMADSASLPPSQQLAKTNAAVTQGILDMALAAGKDAPPALLALVEKTYDANQAAIDAGQSVSGLHTQIINLPDGKKISISVDSNGQAYVDGLQSSLNALVRQPYVARVQLQGPSGPFSIVPVPHASGGPVVPGQPYLVGEHGPELVVPQRYGYMLPSSETRVALAGASAQTSGHTLNQYNTFSPGLSEQQVADMAASSAAWKLRTAR